ncbi:hypothetical protein STEG23_018242, partial [Scotinomys teguina]
MKFAGKWMEREIIILSEVMQTQMDKHGILNNSRINSRTGNFIMRRKPEETVECLTVTYVVTKHQLLYSELSMWSILEKVPWGAEKKQKVGSCLHIHSVNLRLFIWIGKFSSMIILNMFSVPLSWYSSPSSIPIIRRKSVIILKSNVPKNEHEEE